VRFGLLAFGGGHVWDSRVQNEWSSDFGLLPSNHVADTQVFGLKLKLVKCGSCVMCLL
jgi:hypothetical protein